MASETTIKPLSSRKPRRRGSLLTDVKRDRWLYPFSVIPVLYFVVAEESRDKATAHVEWKDPAAFTEWVDKGTEIDDSKNEFFWGVIAGTNSINDFDGWVESVNALGLEDVLTQANELYKTQNEAMEAYLADNK